MRSAARLWLIVVPAALLAGGGAFAFALASGHRSGPLVFFFLALLIGWAFIAAGLLARTRRPDNRTGLLLMAVGFTWLLNGLAEADNSTVWTIGYALSALWAAVFVHALLAYPSGRLQASWERVVVTGGYVLAALAQVSIALFDPDPASCPECPENALLISENDTAATVALAVVQLLAVVYLLAVAIALIARWRSSTPVARRLLGPVLLTGGVSIGLLGISIGLEPVSTVASEVVAVIAALVFLAVPFRFLSGLLRSRLARADVGRLLADLPQGVEPEQAQENLRRALRDPSLELAYWLPERDTFVDVHGRPTPLPAEGSDRAVTRIEYENRPVAALVHDPTLREEPELVDAVVAAARVTIERDRLHAELRARLDELQRERDFVRDVVNAAPSYFAVLHPDGAIIRFNETLATASGLTDDDTTRGRPFWDLFATPEERGELHEWFAAVTRGDERGEHEARMRGADGELVTAWTVTPVSDEQGGRRFLVAGLDLTLRMRQQEELAASEARSRALLEAVPDNIYRVARKDARFLDVSLADASRISLGPDKIIGATLLDLGLPPDFVEQALVAVEKAFESGEVQELEYELNAGPGLEPSHVETRVVPSGEHEYFVIVRDVTDRKQAELEVQRQRDFLDTLGDATPSLLVVLLGDGRMSREPINLAAREFTGLSGSDAEGRMFWDLISAPEDAADAERLIRMSMEKDESVGAETLWLAQGGERRLVAWTCVPLPELALGRSYVISGVDITERSAQEREQAALRRVAVAVASERRTETVFDLVTEEVGRLLDAHSANVVRFEPEGDAIVILGQWSEPGVFAQEVGSRITLEGGPVSMVYETGRPVRVDLDEGLIPPPLADRLKDQGVSSVVAAPIIVSGKLWGAVTVSMTVPLTFPAGSEQRIAEFTRLVALGLANEEGREQLAASRARIVEAGDAERRRLERNLHDGAQQRLVSLSLSLRLAQAKLATDAHAADELLSGASVELALALEELRELARGIHPAVLTERGLGPALESLADRAPVRVELEQLPTERLPGPVEAAAFYVVSEALANVAKYAEASSVRVSVAREDGRAVVMVADDGKGGADPGQGSGLRGLVDRVEALDGHLAVESPAGAGTCVRAEIPLAENAASS